MTEHDGPPGPLRRALGAAAFDTDGLTRLLLDPARALPVPGADDRDTWDPAAGNLDDRWIDQAADGVVLLCEQSSWCWPAHDDAFASHGSLFPAVTDPYVDLGAGEAVAQLAWADQVLGGAFDARYPGLLARVRHEARVRVLEPFTRRRDWHWLGLDGDVHNWNPWIHGNVLAAALRLLDDPTRRHERADVVRLVLEGLERYAAALPADAAVDEGYGYWWNGACRALEALDLLRAATGGHLDAVGAVPALRATMAFPHTMHLGGGWYASLADSQARPPADQPWHALHRAARHVGDDQARRHAAAHRRPGRPAATEAEGLGRLLRGLTDADWLAAAAQASPLPRDAWLPSVQVLVARERAGDPGGLAIVAKGGHNGEHHNHNDIGSFIIACDGVPVVIDAGRPTYTAATFGPDRYSIWTMQSTWHNVPEIAGEAQRAGRRRAAAGVTATVGPESAEFALDLGAAYVVPALRHWRRRVRLDRGGPAARVAIEDLWEFSAELGMPTVIRMLVAGAVRLRPDGALVVPLGGARAVRLGWPADVEAALVRRELDDPLLRDAWGDAITRIDLVVGQRTGLTVTAEIGAPDDKDER